MTEQTDKTKTAEQSHEKQPLKSSKCHKPITCILTPLSLLFALAALVTSGFAIYQNHGNKALQLDNQQQMQQQQNKDHQQLQSLAESINKEGQALQQRVDTLNNQLKETLGQTRFLKQDWLLLKARYYLELASINLQWSDDLNTSIALLKSADELLQSVPDAKIHQIRQALAKEQAELQAAAKTDLPGILSQLDAAKSMVDKLSFNGITMNEAKKKPQTETKVDASGWKAHFNQSLNVLEKLVVIEHHQRDFTPVLSPVHRRILLECMHMNLQVAQWAVLQNNAEIYQQSLTQILEIMKTNCPENDYQVNALNDLLVKLQHVPLRAKKPQLQQALGLLNQYLDARTNRKDDQP